MAMAEMSIPRVFLSRLPAPNVGATERVLNLFTGAALFGYAWRKRSRSLGIASAGMLFRGATGYCPGYAVAGMDHADSRSALSGTRGVHIRESVTIDATPEDLYR